MGVDRGGPPIQRLLGILLVVVVGLTLPVALIMRSFSARVFDPEDVKRALNQNLSASGALRQLVVREMIAESASDRQAFQQLTRDMPQEEVDRLVRLVAPEAWWEAQLSAAVDAFYIWIDSEAPAPELVLDLEPIRANLIGPAGEEVTRHIVASWPPCTPSQVEALAGAARADGSELVARCLPPDPYAALLEGVLLEALREQARAMPSTVDLGRLQTAPDRARELDQLKRALRTLRWAGRWGWLVPMAMLGLIMALNVRSLRTWALWWGAPLLTAGVGAVALALVLAGPVEARLFRGISASIAPEPMSAAVNAVIRELLNDALGSALFTGIATGGLGLVLTLTGIFAPKSRL